MYTQCGELSLKILAISYFLSFFSPEALVRKRNFINVSEGLLFVAEIRKHKVSIWGK